MFPHLTLMNRQSRYSIKRQMDLQILSEWIAEDSNVLDLGCGRGVFLEHLQHARRAYGVGVDTNADKIRDCVKRGINAYQGDILEVMSQYQDGFFDWVVCSRTLQELSNPQRVIHEALRVGRNLAIGFVNYGHWRNRLHILLRGNRIRNAAEPEGWWEGRAQNPVSVTAFEQFCKQEGLHINRHAYLGDNWRDVCKTLPAWRCGYAIYEISRNPASAANPAAAAGSANVAGSAAKSPCGAQAESKMSA